MGGCRGPDGLATSGRAAGAPFWKRQCLPQVDAHRQAEPLFGIPESFQALGGTLPRRSLARRRLASAGVACEHAAMPRPLDLDAYFARIGYDGAPRVDERTLWELHAAHITAIPYETLDIQLGQEKILHEQAMFEKILGRRRGGS